VSNLPWVFGRRTPLLQDVSRFLLLFFPLKPFFVSSLGPPTEATLPPSPGSMLLGQPLACLFGLAVLEVFKPFLDTSLATSPFFLNAPPPFPPLNVLSLHIEPELYISGGSFLGSVLSCAALSERLQNFFFQVSFFFFYQIFFSSD